MSVLRRSARGGLVSFGAIRRGRFLVRGDDPFLPPHVVARDWSILDDPDLGRAFVRRDVGEWAIGPKTLHFIAQRVQSTGVRRVLEFGSGLSTVFLARVLRDRLGRHDAAVVSIDESEAFLDATRSLLNEFGLAAVAETYCRPPRVIEVEGAEIRTYDLDPELLETVTARLLPDLVLIDGPSGGGLGRYAALALLRPYLRAGTTVMLDDALRDEELAVAQRWQEEGILEIEGIQMNDHGLLVGRIPGATSRS